MMYPLVLDLAADGIPVAVTCRVLGFSKQAFYKWRKKHPVTQRDWDDAHLINAALDIHADDPAFGYRFIADELPGRGHRRGREPGRPVVLSSSGSGRCFAKKTRPEPQGRPAGPRRPRRAPIHRAGAEPLWLTDITEHRTERGQALPLRDQGRVLQPDRRLLDRLADESIAGRVGPAQRDRRCASPPADDRALAIEAVNSGPEKFVRMPRRPTACAARWAVSERAVTTPRWNRSSRCCRRTSWTGNAGPPAHELRLAIVTWIETHLPPHAPATPPRHDSPRSSLRQFKPVALAA